MAIKIVFTNTVPFVFPLCLRKLKVVGCKAQLRNEHHSLVSKL
jgi:hypothetical protein